MNVCIKNRSIPLFFCPKKFQCLSSVPLNGLLFLIAQGNSGLVNCEAFQPGFWKKKKRGVKTGRGLGVFKEWKVNCC